MKERYLGHNLRKLRKQKGKTLKEVSKETGLAVSTIEDIENKISFSNYISTIVALSNYFEVKVHDFVYKKF
ncbi:helix-turn-helix domain-containing protein [Paraclostridium sordellii]|uniref:helix-turn-helix domain-containing protein n=1 Tax=Paraclostridium sordellii TaxID=1505 RepID=UPI0015F62BA3|nr:helix-turn-helix transcriptional regulator [Paeniclostridium sordellii]